MHRTAAAVLLVWTVVLGCCVFLVDRGVAAAPPAFALRFEANTNGSILLRGNASLVCRISTRTAGTAVTGPARSSTTTTSRWSARTPTTT